MAPQTRVSMTNVIAMLSIVLAIFGASTILYAQVQKQTEINARQDSKIMELSTSVQETNKLLVTIRESQIRTEEQLLEMNQRSNYRSSYRAPK